VPLPDEDPTRGPNRSELSEDDPAARSSDEPTGLADAVSKPDATAVEAFHQRARLAEDRLAEVLGAYRSLRTENEGFRDRTAKNIERRFDQRRERLLLKFIDILDNLDRALEAAEQSYAAQPLIEGLILVRTQLLQTLQDEGLERLPALGLPYDPTISEAVELRPVDDPDHHNLVVQEALRGYRLNGRIARASRVVVGQFHGEPVAAPADHEEAASERPEAPAVEAAPEPPAEGSEPSLEDIVSRAEAQEALFPKAFEALPDDDEPE
jgi:molecular chaperone GrpE